jgi:hypothetical protein
MHDNDEVAGSTGKLHLQRCCVSKPAWCRTAAVLAGHMHALRTGYVTGYLLIIIN